MLTRSLQELAAKAEEMYELMEYYRTGSQANKVVSSLSFGYVKPLSVKINKFDALTKANNDAERRNVLTALKQDKEVLASTSLKNIVAILDHAFEASLGQYVEDTENTANERLTPAEAAKEAIKILTPTYNQQFIKVPNKSEFLLLVAETLNERLIIEKQQAVEATRQEEKHQKRLALAETKAIAELTQQLALDAAHKASAAMLETAHRKAEEADEHAYRMNAEAQSAREIEAAKNKNLTRELENLKVAHQQLQASANSANDELLLAGETMRRQNNTISQLTDITKQEINRLDNELADTTSEMHRLECELADTRNEKKCLQEDFDKLRNRNTHLENRLSSALSDLHTAISERDTYLKKMNKLSREYRAQEDTLNLATQLIAMHDTTAAETKTENNRLKKQLTDAHRDQSESHIKITQLQHSVETLTTKTEQLEDDVHTHAAMHAVTQETLQETQDELKHCDFTTEHASHQETKKALNFSEGQNNHLTCELSSLSGTYKAELEKNKRLQRDFTALTESLNVNEQRLAHSAANVRSHGLHKQRNQHQQPQQQLHEKKQARFGM